MFVDFDELFVDHGATVDTLIVVFAPAFFTISQILQSSSLIPPSLPAELELLTGLHFSPQFLIGS